MWHTLLTLYGPIAIHGYGFMIALGLLIFFYLIRKNQRFHELNLEEPFTGIILVGVLTAVVGGRILFFLSYPEFLKHPIDFFFLWQGGLSSLGCIIAVLLIMPLYLRFINIPIIGLLDLLAIYAPIIHAAVRLGCFLSGCCYGIPTTHSWGITYTDTLSAAPLFVCLHPTQLYSALGLVFIFAFMYFFAQYFFVKSGQLICVYLMATSLERFVVDFWRGDRIPSALFSLNQDIALAIFVSAIIGLVIITFFYKQAS